MENSIPGYKAFIVFLILMLFHKTISLTQLLNIPIYDVRYFFNILEPICILLFLIFFKLNRTLILILLLLLVAPLRYWIFDQDLIYYFVNKNPRNDKTIHFFKNEFAYIVKIDWIFAVIGLYIVFK